MRNHDQKNKDVCESVLPSTSRKNARQERRIAHGANRAVERAALRGAGRRDYEGSLADADRRCRLAVREMVWSRRAADKIGSLVRWARVTVERDPRLRGASREEVLAHFAGLLPDNMIGRHAVQHIEYGLFGYGFSRSISWEELQSHRCAAETVELERFRANIVALMRAGCHRDINGAVRRRRAPQLDAIERAKQDGQHWDRLSLLPLLDGMHELDAFVAAAQHDRLLRNAVEQLARDVL